MKLHNVFKWYVYDINPLELTDQMRRAASMDANEFHVV